MAYFKGLTVIFFQFSNLREIIATAVSLKLGVRCSFRFVSFLCTLRFAGGEIEGKDLSGWEDYETSHRDGTRTESDFIAEISMGRGKGGHF